MTERPPHPLAECPADVLLSIAAHISVRDIRNMASTCRSVRSTLVASQGANAVLWAPRVDAAFPSAFHRPLVDGKSQAEDPEVAFVDRFRLPLRGLSSAAASDASEGVNLPLLASLLPRKYPKGIDTNTLQCEIGSARDAKTRVRERFLGPVTGTGNHCVRSNEPFPTTCRAVSPRPSGPMTRWIKKFGRRVGAKSNPELVSTAPELPPSPSQHSLLHRFISTLSGPPRRESKRSLGHLCRRGNPRDDFRPFVVPTVVSESSDAKSAKRRLLVDVTPRLVAYFEANIADQTQDASMAFRGEREISQNHRLVAIGLSIHSFCTRDNLPGWDDESYGYHGDDGRFFHRGRAAAPTDKSPTFGPGDTVGCGLEYSSRRVFFTKNGAFVGYARKVGKDVIEKGLYPTVGVDTQCPVRLNFGGRPFEFDVVMFAAIH